MHTGITDQPPPPTVHVYSLCIKRLLQYHNHIRIKIHSRSVLSCFTSHFFYWKWKKNHHRTVHNVTLFLNHICCTLQRWLFFAPETGSLDADMNLTQVDSNATITLNYWNTFVKAVGKNVTVVVLGITINYINATMIHTFNKYHVCKVGLLLYFTCQRVVIFCYLYYFLF